MKRYLFWCLLCGALLVAPTRAKRLNDTLLDFEDDDDDDAPIDMPDLDDEDINDGCIKKKKKVIIVGGGLAGIAAGLRLNEVNEDPANAGKKTSFKILESNERVGGRAIAAHWIEGKENPLMVFLENNNLENNVVESFFNNIVYYRGDGQV